MGNVRIQPLSTYTQTAIKASELRIGNWLITYATALPQYFKITSWHIKYFDENGIRDESPIPLTPEILEKCLSLPVKMRLIPFRVNDFFFYYEDVPLFPVHYVHQLQNLYFALTQTELPITL